jgi:hypothetical protein
MQAAAILTNVAIILVAAAVWDDLRRGGRANPGRMTWLGVACLFALISAVLHLLP